MTHSASLRSKGRTGERAPGKNGMHAYDERGVVATDESASVVASTPIVAVATPTSIRPPAPTTRSEAATPGTASDFTCPLGLAPVFFFTSVVVALVAAGLSRGHFWDTPWSTGPNHDESSEVHEPGLTSDTDVTVHVSLASNQETTPTSSSWHFARTREADVVSMTNPHGDYGIHARADVPIILKVCHSSTVP